MLRSLSWSEDWLRGALRSEGILLGCDLGSRRIEWEDGALADRLDGTRLSYRWHGLGVAARRGDGRLTDGAARRFVSRHFPCADLPFIQFTEVI